jgi:type II secretory pathway component GspD/PulD (secretin)
VKIREMLEQLVPEESSSRHLVVYPVGPEAASYATTLLTSVIPQPRYVWDTTHHRMMVWATPSEHEQLAEVFNQVADDESSNMELIVYPVDPDVVTSLASLLSTAAPEARVVPDTRTGRLMVWATQATHTTVAETIAKVVETESGALELVIYPMRAEDAAYAPTLVTSVAPQARYAPDTVHGRMLVWATPDEHEKLKRAFAEASVDASGEMSLVVYPTDSSSTANLQSLASSIVPQARVIPDARTGSLMVWATRTDHAKLTDALAKVTSSTSDEMKFVVYSVDTTLAPSLMGMVNSIAPQAKVVPDYTTGSLLVWANQQDQDTIKETLDRAGTDPARAMKLTVYPIESAQSSSITALLSQIVPRARVNYDTHSGNLLVWASEQDHAAVGEAMAQVGQSTDAGRYLLVYPLTGVNLASVTSVLSNVVPQARFIPEQQSGNLLAWGTQAEHEHIADAIEKVGKSSSENSLKVYALQGRPASTLATLLTGVVPQVRQTVDTNSGTVMVWASAADHALIEDAIAEIEAEQTAGYQPEVRIYDVLTADSVAVLSSLQTMFANRPDVRLSRDARTERIVAWGGEADHQQIGDVIAKFEEASPQLSTMQLEVYDLGTADSRTVVEALTPMFKDIKGTELIPDSANHQLIALALPEQQATIDATIRQLQAAKKDFDVLQLERVDTFTADDAIKTLFNGDPTPPTVDADYANQRVMVRGSDEQLEEIRQLLFKMGETNLAPSRRDDRRTMRVISVNGDIERALQEIQRVWPQLRGNPVRVVKPSAVYPTLRSNRKADEKPSPPAADEQSETTPAEETPEANTSPNDQSSINATRPEPLASRSVSPGSFTSPLALGVRSLATSLAVVNMLMQNVDEAVAATTTGPDDEPNVAESTATAPAAQPTENEPQPSPGDETSPIIVSPGVDGVTIVSDDTEALDDFEKLLRSILQNEANRQPEFKMIQLKHADATILTDTLEKAFGKSSSGTRYRSRTYGNRSSLTPPTFVAYERLNAVLVRADPEDLDAIERLVEALDTSELPETLLAPQPMQIQLKYAKAFRIERLLRDVYREQLSGQGRRRRVPTGFASALRELRGSGLSSDMTMTAIQQLTAQNQGPELTIGVDEQTNSLVIMASKPLLDEVREMVEALDVAADEAYHTVKVVPLEKTNAEAVQKALNMFTRERQVRDR